MNRWLLKKSAGSAAHVNASVIGHLHVTVEEEAAVGSLFWFARTLDSAAFSTGRPDSRQFEQNCRPLIWSADAY
jgi:hypothetical protein